MFSTNGLRSLKVKVFESENIIKIVTQKSRVITKSVWNLKKIRIPKKDGRLAEFIGIVLGDGYIQSYRKGTKISTHRVAIAGNSKKDFVYLKKYLTPLIKELFDIILAKLTKI